MQEGIEELIERADALNARVCEAQRAFLEVIARIDACEGWRDAGARDMAHWLWMRYGVSSWKARRWIASAQALQVLPAVSTAFEKGELGIDKVVELTRMASFETEDGLVAWASRVSSGRIRRQADLEARRALDDVQDLASSRSVKWWYFDEGRRFGLEAEMPADQGAVVRKALDGRVPLIGFSGSPYTLACYMVEGGGSDDFRTLKSMLFGRPDLLHRILEVNARAVTAYLNAQIEAGAQAVMIFDTWGGNLSSAGYEEFSLAYSRRVIAGLTKESEGRRVPCILFTKGGAHWLEAMAATGCDALGLDWSTDLRAARLRVGSQVALQGNLDPGALFAPPGQMRIEARRVLDAFGPGPGHVFNLGHGISQFTPPEAVAALTDEVHTYSMKLRMTGAL